MTSQVQTTTCVIHWRLVVHVSYTCIVWMVIIYPHLYVGVLYTYIVLLLCYIHTFCWWRVTYIHFVVDGSYTHILLMMCYIHSSCRWYLINILMIMYYMHTSYHTHTSSSSCLIHLLKTMYSRHTSCWSCSICIHLVNDESCDIYLFNIYAFIQHICPIVYTHLTFHVMYKYVIFRCLVHETYVLFMTTWLVTSHDRPYLYIYTYTYIYIYTHIYIYKHMYIYTHKNFAYVHISCTTTSRCMYGVATVSRIDKIIRLFLQNSVSFIGLFCKRDL